MKMKAMKELAVAAALLLAADLALAARTCKVAIEGNDQMKYNLAEIKVAGDCTEVELTLKHSGKLPVQTMGHNVVITKTADFMAIANAAVSAGLAKGYVPQDKRVIAHTKLVGGGETATVRFATAQLTKGGDYTFFCSFPGHYGLMKGKLIFK